MKYNIVSVVFLSLYAGSCLQSAVSQQCDVVVTSHASLKLGNLSTNFDGNAPSCLSACNEIIDELESRLEELLDEKIAIIQQAILNSTRDLLHRLPRSGASPSQPARTCAEILSLIPNSPSGHYWIESNDTAVRMYCDMTRSCGNVTGGWTRVADLDMTDENYQCPSGLSEITESSQRACRRGNLEGCRSLGNLVLPSLHQYSRVCGQVIAFQFGQPEAFNDPILPLRIGGKYLDGVSITSGSGSQQLHIWSFAAARSEIDASNICPCINQAFSSNNQPPDFVGDDYFCDTGASGRAANIFYGDDPLWDGAGCGPQSTCCSFNTPPWFYKELASSTTEDIEVRVCSHGIRGGNEYIAIQKIQIFVQ